MRRFTRVRIKLDFVADFGKELGQMPVSDRVLDAAEAALRALVKPSDFDNFDIAIEPGVKCQQTMLPPKKVVPRKKSGGKAVASGE